MVCDDIRHHHAEEASETDIHAFARAITYSQGHFDEPEAYERLGARLRAIDAEWGVCANKLFYLAVPPGNYETILQQLFDAGLASGCPSSTGETGWTRVIIEKPFGRDGESARALDDLLGSLFEERQIYRIDHYLAKEMLQGVMSFRFSNNLFEPSWGGRAIQRIEIDLLEEGGADGRGAFYDSVGALRDVGQNHVLQMLALITMAQPADMSVDAIRASRVAALRTLRPMAPQDVAHKTFRAQYDGYAAVEGVAAGSQTETYFELVTELDSDRWRGVPIVMRAGKALGRARKRIVVEFKQPAPCLCDGVDRVDNTVTFALEPADSITIGFWTKKPGFDADIEKRDFNFFLYQREEKTEYVEEYAKLLADAVAGDQTLFVSRGEVEAMWAFTDPIVKGWADGLVPLETYPRGSDEVLARASGVLAGSAVREALKREIGVVGLGKMGAGIARNLVDHGWRTVGFNRTAAVTERLAADGVVPAHTLAELVEALEAPRTVWLMGPAGGRGDERLFGAGGLAELLERGDTVIDGGNSHYKDAAPRAARLAETGVRFMDAGVSGGPSGARGGACLLVGGSREDFDRLGPLWRDLSVEGGFRHFEGVGAGHFVKMVHNGIEYGMMQAIAEGFTVLRASDFSLDLTQAAAVYNRGSVIESRLVGWLENGFRLHGEALDGVSGSVAHTGGGEWTVQAAADLGVKARVIEDALAFRVESERDPSWTGRVLSALREQFGRHDVRAG